jgi:hypothetical protein
MNRFWLVGASEEAAANIFSKGKILVDRLADVRALASLTKSKKLPSTPAGKGIENK